MAAAKKFSALYAKSGEKGASEREALERDKALIKEYVSKIEDLLTNDPKAQKRAADILSDLLNSKKPTKKSN